MGRIITIDSSNAHKLKVKCTNYECYSETIEDRNKLHRQILNTKNCCGLAFNQIGGNKRLYAIKNPTIKIYVNPTIVELSKDTYETFEGCMSFPKHSNSKVLRNKSITIKHLNSDGVYITETFDGVLAQIHQHELDHLDGIDIHHKKIKENK